MTTEISNYLCTLLICPPSLLSLCTKHIKPYLQLILPNSRITIHLWTGFIVLTLFLFFPSCLKRIYKRELKKSMYENLSPIYNIYLCSISNLQFIFRLLQVLTYIMSARKQIGERETMVDESGAEGTTSPGFAVSQREISEPDLSLKYTGVNHKLTGVGIKFPTKI